MSCDQCAHARSGACIASDSEEDEGSLAGTAPPYCFAFADQCRQEGRDGHAPSSEACCGCQGWRLHRVRRRTVCSRVCIDVLDLSRRKNDCICAHVRGEGGERRTIHYAVMQETLLFTARKQRPHSARTSPAHRPHIARCKLPLKMRSAVEDLWPAEP